MKFRYIVITLVILAAVCVTIYSMSHHDKTTRNSLTCDPVLWQHVYHSSRLHVINQCVTITGVIIKTRAEKDGDKHIQVRVDSQFQSMLNEVNLDKQDGNLVIEPICVGRVTQEDAIAACEGVDPLQIPKTGSYIQAIGPLVFDTEHGWNEVHPVTSIVVIH